MNAELAIVLGSGLGVLAEHLQIEETLGFAEAGLPVSHVAGHAGRFVMGTLAGKKIIAMQGRIHLYEGHDAKSVSSGIRWLHEHGVKRIILTNAAGTLRADFPPGNWMMLEDHLNLTGTSPLEGGANFIDMSEVYSRAWRNEFLAESQRLAMPLHQGVYAGLRGPQYETPAEIRMLRTMGADAVGMSTVLEAMQAKALGMEVLGFSCLTNWAAGISSDGLDHADVLATGKIAASAMVSLLTASLSKISL
jgi:purine-nucleoside phosphorylase